MTCKKAIHLSLLSVLAAIVKAKASFIVLKNPSYGCLKESLRAKIFQHGTAVVHPKGQETYGHEYFDSPVMQQLDDLERRMKRNQESARELISTVQKDVAMQKLLRSESAAAMERLHSIKYDMTRQLNQAREHYLDDRKQLIQKMTAEINFRDEKIEQYEDERNSFKFLFLRILKLLKEKLRSRNIFLRRK